MEITITTYPGKTPIGKLVFDSEQAITDALKDIQRLEPNHLEESEYLYDATNHVPSSIPELAFICKRVHIFALTKYQDSYSHDWKSSDQRAGLDDTKL